MAITGTIAIMYCWQQKKKKKKNKKKCIQNRKLRYEVRIIHSEEYYVCCQALYILLYSRYICFIFICFVFFYHVLTRIKTIVQIKSNC